MRFHHVTTFFKNIRYHLSGTCPICGKHTIFFCRDILSARNNMWCLFCRSSSRKRHIARIILDEIVHDQTSIVKATKKLHDITIYNTDGNDQLTRFLYPASENYFCSDFVPGTPPGTELRPRVYCQDIQQLTFQDSLFDLVISEDVFEHVRNHEKGFSEVYRVLQPGGRHVFTVPFLFDQPTVVRVDTSGDEDIHRFPPEYHEDSLRGKILAYRTFGFDMFNLLRSIGFETSVRFSEYADKRYGIVNSHVFVSKKRSK